MHDVTYMEWQPNGSRLLCGMRSGLLSWSSRGHSSEVTCVTCTPESFISVSADGVAKIWDNEFNMRSTEYRFPNAVYAGCPIDETLARNTVHGDVELVHGATKQRLDSKSPCTCISWDPNGVYLYVGCENGTVLVWNTKDNTSKTMDFGGTTRTISVACNTNNIVATCDLGRRLYLWRNAPQKQVLVSELCDSPTHITWCPTHRNVFAMLVGGSLVIYDMDVDAQIAEYPNISAYAWHPSGSFISAFNKKDEFVISVHI